MILTAKQELGLKVAIERYKNKEKFTVISGYAGSGKSTLIKFIIEALKIDEDKVCYATFTGKAAQVLLTKGNKNVSTLHHLLYEAYPLPNGKFRFVPKKTIDYKVVIVDEVSMAPKSLMELLFKHNCYILCLGDPFQIQPIYPNEDNHILDNPHIFLDEIMRQAQESEIIRLSMDIRNYKKIDFFEGEEVKVLPKEALVTGMYEWADQIIVGTNKMRNSINDQVRELKGYGAAPREGDKIICLRNYWEDISYQGSPLVNGTIGYISNVFDYDMRIPFKNVSENKIKTLVANFKSDFNENYGSLEIDYNMLVNNKKTLSQATEYQCYKRGLILPKDFAYGYAITCHKAQGSEYEKVLAIEERFPFDKEEHARWLYTVVTRASSRLVLIR